ncbi:hypothetical protein PHYBLDRAFT_72785 [Phycomyces blakesleeanus NRRL 1555(-)]|uniref:DDE Tnp4 domain-containing protein n=1 Tax=Phycomyces blakesleeanus (strain ATCC 8743b / DSM 1359 / FGSC 10004 / NBRC 33097 / NRRL 1555) TaxID=763407 RepID=A0A162Q9U9_PHYB8|nr:hypothetical protein PHYBLDRAFT_72785 [Phycomyces blakesleeanus NRRL 1555(-)]OAD81276.1 hypothetical protein PHYBLDRAFT_72785 [Phycomyces blakesleeanus NRRL 1555(-)]|eukprot:XP_018299316.1 hypothetical protein PHYBLDRAFT_72785 [Phycomyces blakesleeanus NRRL 1555(-)]
MWREHGLKYQAVIIPDSITSSIMGPETGNQHNMCLYLESHLEDKMHQIFDFRDINNGPCYFLYIDPAYTASDFMIVPFDRHLGINKNMSAVRIVVEHEFAHVRSLYVFLKYSQTQRSGHCSVKLYYIVRTLLKNTHVCFNNGNRTIFVQTCHFFIELSLKSFNGKKNVIASNSVYNVRKVTTKSLQHMHDTDHANRSLFQLKGRGVFSRIGSLLSLLLIKKVINFGMSLVCTCHLSFLLVSCPVLIDKCSVPVFYSRKIYFPTIKFYGIDFLNDLISGSSNVDMSFILWMLEYHCFKHHFVSTDNYATLVSVADSTGSWSACVHWFFNEIK